MLSYYQVDLTFVEPVLGSAPKDPEIYTKYIASKAVSEGGKEPEDVEDEAQLIKEAEEKGWTGFLYNAAGEPGVMDHVIKGMFKGACSALRRDGDTRSSKIRAYKKIVDQLVMVAPRFIPIEAAGEGDVLERALRAQTPQGERVTLARSDRLPHRSTMKFWLRVQGRDVSLPLLKEWLDHGLFVGLGQWRSGGWGRFVYSIQPSTEKEFMDIFVNQRRAHLEP